MRAIALFAVSLYLACTGQAESVAERAAPLQLQALPTDYCYRIEAAGATRARGCGAASVAAAYREALAVRERECRNTECQNNRRIAITPNVGFDSWVEAIRQFGHQAVRERVAAATDEIHRFFHANDAAHAVDYQATLEGLASGAELMVQEANRDIGTRNYLQQRMQELPKRLAEQGQAIHGEEQARLAQERLAAESIRRFTEEYVQRIRDGAEYREIEAQYSDIQAAEEEVAGALRALVQRINEARDEPALDGLGQEVSTLSAGAEQEVEAAIDKAMRIQRALEEEQARYEDAVYPYRELMARQGMKAPELAGDMLGALDRMLVALEAYGAWLREAVTEVQTALGLRREALRLASMDEDTRAQVMAMAHAEAAAVLAEDARDMVVAATRPGRSLFGLELLEARYRGALALIQLGSICAPASPATRGRALVDERCSAYRDNIEQVRRYLDVELPSILNQRIGDLVRLSATTAMTDALRDALERDDVASAVRIHDAILRGLAARSHAQGPASAVHSSPVATLRRQPDSSRVTATTAVLEWELFSFADSCLHADDLEIQGQANFYVNGVPIPTYTRSRHVYSHGGRKGIHVAQFSTSLFRVGRNIIEFTFHNSSNTPACNHVHSKVHLVGVSREPILLFDVRSHGSDFHGETDVALTLEQIAPDLARSIARLKRDVATRLKELEQLGRNADRAVAEARLLRVLVADIDALVARGFDRIDLDELDALLAEYSNLVPDNIRADVRQVMKDLRASIEAVRAEIENIAGHFHTWADGLAASLQSAAAVPADYHIQTESLPAVDIPELPGPESGPGTDTDEESNAFDDYADQVIARLQATLDPAGETVIARAEFLDIVAVWRRDMHAFEAAFDASGVVDLDARGALVRSEERVIGVVSRFVDEEGWFRDTPVDPEIRQLVSVALKRIDVPRAERLEAALQVLGKLDREQAKVLFAWVYIIRELDIAIAEAYSQREAAKLRAQQLGMFESVGSFVSVVASAGWEAAVAVTPVGDVIDVCEAVTGKAGCDLVNGRELSWQERAFSTVGLFMWGSAATLRKLGQGADLVACRPADLRARPLPEARLLCDVRAYLQRIGEALDNVPKRHPVSDVADVITDAKGTVYVHKNGTRVRFNQRGFPVYEREHMHGGPEPAEVWIEFACNGKVDRRRANQASKRSETPAEYTWHHSHQFRGRNGKIMIKMQLVREDVHKWTQHTGGFAIGKYILGADKCRR